MGDFTFPQHTRITFEPSSRTEYTDIPGKVCDDDENLGAHSAKITVTCDLDQRNSTDDWMRPQGTLTPKTDVYPGQVFDDISHGGDIDEPWQWLILGHRQLKVRVDKVEFNYTDEMNSVTLYLTEVSLMSKDRELYTERFNIT